MNRAGKPKGRGSLGAVVLRFRPVLRSGTPQWGVNEAAGDIDGGEGVTLWFSLQAFPAGWTCGASTAGGRFEDARDQEAGVAPTS